MTFFFESNIMPRKKKEKREESNEGSSESVLIMTDMILYFPSIYRPKLNRSL